MAVVAGQVFSEIHEKLVNANADLYKIPSAFHNSFFVMGHFCLTQSNRWAYPMSENRIRHVRVSRHPIGDKDLPARKANCLTEKNEERPKLPLKHNGAEVRVATALASLRDIRFVASSKERLESLMDLANGRFENVPQAVLNSAKTFGMLAADGKTLKDEYRVVLLSAFQVTPEGPVMLTCPFVLKTVADRLIVEQEQRECDRIYRSIRNLPDDYEIDEQDSRSP